MIRRREFITLLGGAAAWPLAARAQQLAMPVIGFLHIASPGAYVHVIAGFRRGLAESDFVEGRDITVEYRWGEGELGRMPSLLADLLRHQVSVIVGSLQGAQAEIEPIQSARNDGFTHGAETHRASEQMAWQSLTAGSGSRPICRDASAWPPFPRL